MYNMHSLTVITSRKVGFRIIRLN